METTRAPLWHPLGVLPPLLRYINPPPQVPVLPRELLHPSSFCIGRRLSVLAIKRLQHSRHLFSNNRFFCRWSQQKIPCFSNGWGNARSSAVAERPRDASCLSLYLIVQYVERNLNSASDLPLRTNKICSLLFSIFTDTTQLLYTNAPTTVNCLSHCSRCQSIASYSSRITICSYATCTRRRHHQAVLQLNKTAKF